ncbi:MAG TPA: energy transducer TonB [Acidocella sp.]|nr:energy transducer TonB [Acidocella sp.]
MLEIGALLLFMPLMAQHENPAATPSPIKLSIIAPAPTPPPPTPPKPTPPTPVTPPTPTPVAPPQPMPPPPPPRPAIHHQLVHHMPPPRPVPQPVVQQPPTPAPPPPPAAPAAPTGGQVDAFRAAIKSAVQSVANQVYPQAAQMAHESGMPEVTFTYLNGTVTNIAISRSSGYPLLDEAAMQAVRIAPYPAPPAAFANHTYSWTVAVIFRLAAPSIEAD